MDQLQQINKSDYIISFQYYSPTTTFTTTRIFRILFHPSKQKLQNQYLKRQMNTMAEPGQICVRSNKANKANGKE